MPARISRITLRSSIASLGRAQAAADARARRAGPRAADFSASAIERISASVAGSAIRLVSAFELVLGRAIGLYRFHDRRQLGEFARELDVGLGRNRRGEFAFERSMAGDKRVEFLVG